MSTLLQLSDELIDAAKALSVSARNPSWLYSEHYDAFIEATRKIHEYYAHHDGETVSVPCQILKVYLDVDRVLHRIIGNYKHQQYHAKALERLMALQLWLGQLIAEGYRQIQPEVAREIPKAESDDEPVKQELAETTDRGFSHAGKLSALAEMIRAVIHEYGVAYLRMDIVVTLGDDVFAAIKQGFPDVPSQRDVVMQSGADWSISLARDFLSRIPMMQRDQIDPEAAAKAEHPYRAASSERVPLDTAKAAEIAERVRAAMHSQEISPDFVSIRIIAEQSYFDLLRKSYPAGIDQTIPIAFRGRKWGFSLERYAP